MGKRLEKLKKAKAKLKAAGERAYYESLRAHEKAVKYRDIAYKKGREIQAKAQYLKETYPVFGGTEELFGFDQPVKNQPRSPDLMGNVGGVGVIDFGLGDYAGRAAPVPKVDEQAIQKELNEHPWADRATAARIARDHKKRRHK